MPNTVVTFQKYSAWPSISPANTASAVDAIAPRVSLGTYALPTFLGVALTASAIWSGVLLVGVSAIF